MSEFAGFWDLVLNFTLYLYSYTTNIRTDWPLFIWLGELRVLCVFCQELWHRVTCNNA